MTENIFTTHTEPQTDPAGDPTLRRNLELPKGVLQKNLKIFVYLGAALLVIVAALFSSSGKKTPAQQAGAKGQPPQPTLQDNTDSNVQELKNQIQAERQKERQATIAAAAIGDPALASATPAQRSVAAAYGPNGLAAPCVPGQPCSQLQQGDTQMQPTPLQQQAQLIAAKERERADNSRFASNLVFSRSVEQAQQQQAEATPTKYGPADRKANSNPPAPEAERKQEDTPGGYKRPLEANVDSATGQPYLIYEGSVLDTVLMNRLDGDAVGPVKVLVSNPLYSHDHQHVIIPEGTVVLGEAKKIGAAGFGHPFVPSAAERIRVLLHTLDRFKGCFNEQGQRNDEGHALYANHFSVQKGWFSDSSDAEKNEFHAELTFPHPQRPGETLFCPWHGKVKTPQIRIHFSWPVRANEPLYVVYVGPKRTKR